MDTFLRVSFGALLMHLFQGLLSTPSWQTVTYLACGWALTTDRHTMTTYVWLTGATTIKHFSRFCVFLGSALLYILAGCWAHYLLAQASPTVGVER